MEKKIAITNEEQKTKKRLGIDKYVQSFKKLPNTKKLIFTAFPIVLITLFVFLKLNINVSTKQDGQMKTTQKSQTEEDRFALPLKSGIVCAGLGNYSFQMDFTSSPIAESDKALILQSESGLLLISKGEIKIEEVLKERSIPFEKEGDTYIFSLSSSDSPVSAMSIKKGDYTISLLYNPTDKEKAEKTLQTVVSSIKGGCSGV